MSTFTACRIECRQISMCVDKRTNKTMFSNFLSHLKNNHPDVLHEEEVESKALENKRQKRDMNITAFIATPSPTQSTISLSSSKVDKASFSFAKHDRMVKLKHRLITVFGRVCAHGPYPFSILLMMVQL